MRLAGQAGSIAGVFSLHHDNNHHLNTLWLLAMGPEPSPWAARFPAALSGAALVALAALRPIGRRRLEGFAAAVLLGGSYLLVHYGSEARGYGPALLFSFGAYLALEAHLERRDAGTAAAFAALGTLALLAHLTAVFVLGAAWLRATVALASEWRARRPAPVPVALLAAPAAALLVLWAVDLRHLAVGGGPPFELATVLRELVRTALGLPRGWPEVLALVPAGLAALALADLVRRRDGRAVFHVAVLALPVALLAARRPDYLAPRYFLLAVPFALLLVARGLALAAAGGRGRTALAVGGLAAFAGAQVPPIARLVEVGRGGYGQATRLILSSSPGATTVGSDHDFRNGLVLDDQLRRLGASDRVRYLPQGTWTSRDPEWLIVHAFEEDPAGEPGFALSTGAAYGRVAVFPYAGLSGFSWILYRREAPQAP